jgi:hypothetical protein
MFSSIILDAIIASDKGHIVSGPQGHDKNQVPMFNALLTVLQYDFFIF